jgi:hypothetical protein
MQVKLSKPLVTHKGEVSEIELKEPTCASFVKHADPFKITWDEAGRASYDFNSKACVGFLTDMTGYDEIILGKIAAKDFMTLRYAMVGVIMGTAGANPTST